jgi:two-component system OmpR family response regulator
MHLLDDADLTARHLINPEGVIVVLSGAEFRLLKVLLSTPSGS